MAQTTRLGAYVLIRRIGVGGMGEVFLARRGGEDLVVKVLSPHLMEDAAAVDMLANEARLASALVHPNVVRVHGLERDGGRPFLVMEYVPGLSFSRAVKTLGRRAMLEALAGATQGLHYVHEFRRDALGLVHRDFSGENVLLSIRGEVKLADFGLVKATVVSQQSSTIRGKVAHLAPELFSGGAPSVASDLYAVGVTLYHALSGGYPFGASWEPASIRKVLEEPPPPLPGAPKLLDALLAKDPAQRPKSAAEVAAELSALAAVEKGPALAEWARKLPPPEKLEATYVAVKTKHASRRALFAGGGVALALAAAAVVLLWPAPPASAIVETTAEADDEVEDAGTLPAAVARGSLSVRVSPWAEVWIDGRLIGTTPLQPLKLEAGKHVVLLKNKPLKLEGRYDVVVQSRRQTILRAELDKR